MSLEVIKQLTEAYEVFNEKLFNKELPPCVVTLGKKAGALGVFMPSRWRMKSEFGTETDSKLLVETAEDAPELRMVPSYFKSRSTKEILSTLLHEMVHWWRASLCEKKKTKRHHDKHWAAKMEELGLMPYNINNPEKKTGHKCSHTIMEGGIFNDVATSLIEKGLEIRYYFAERSSSTVRQYTKKIKYTCPVCESVVRGVPGLSIKCVECDQDFEEAV